MHDFEFLHQHGVRFEARQKSDKDTPDYCILVFLYDCWDNKLVREPLMFKSEGKRGDTETYDPSY